MGLDVSPDLSALACYLVVLAAGALASLFQLYDKLGTFRGAWVMAETWALYAVYTLFPVALFWLLDRTNAIHDTSLFAALIIGVGYQQILSGQLSSIKAPSEAAGFWQFFSTWADLMSARIRTRIQSADRWFKEATVNSVLGSQQRFDALRQLAMVVPADPAQLTATLAAIQALQGQIGDRGVLERQTRVLCETVWDVDAYARRLKDRGIISRLTYYWYAQEWRSKTAAIAIAAALAGPRWWQATTFTALGTNCGITCGDWLSPTRRAPTACGRVRRCWRYLHSVPTAGLTASRKCSRTMRSRWT